MAIKTFEELTVHLKSWKRRKRVGVVCPSDESTLKAVQWAEKEGVIEPFVFDDTDTQTAARKAVEAVRRGQIDIIMKGLINSDVLLRAILDKEKGILKANTVLTHLTVAEMETYHKLLFFTDAAVIPHPTQEQRRAQVEYVLDLCRRFGIAKPKLSLIHCSEKVDVRHFPHTADYEEIEREAAEGRFGDCIIDGPLDLKTSCSKASLEMKHIDSPVAGDADALVFPDIESGNTFYKAITLFCHARTAGVLKGTDVPVVMPSRADSPESKYLSLCTACLL